jgi:hypothetical protein
VPPPRARRPTQTLAGTGTDGLGCYTTTETPTDSPTLVETGNFGSSLTFTTTDSSTTTEHEVGTPGSWCGATGYNINGASIYRFTLTDSSTTTETENYGTGVYSATQTASDTYTLNHHGHPRADVP